jgi:DNA-binding transcriptional ArsR family regulator
LRFYPVDVTANLGRIVDATALKGLAHPLRMAILESLETRGRATASMLAADLGESSGATSYHLRQLFRHGFVEEVPDHGNARERWWRPVTGGWSLPPERFTDEPGVRAATDLVFREILDSSNRRLQYFMANLDRWPAEWQQAAQRSEARFDLDATQLAALNAEIHAVIDRYRDLTPAAGGRRVQIELTSFPLGDAEPVAAERESGSSE